jgi:hypothetical protein
MAVPDDQSRGTVSPTPTTGRGRSAARPQRLMDYSSAGSEMLGLLRAKQTALHTALEALRPHASSQYVPSLQVVDRQLDTLIADWAHLDTFVGDVGQAFADAAAGGNVPNVVVSFSDSQLAQVAHVGYANREEAIDAANAAARELEELLDQDWEDVSHEEIEALMDEISRGQADPVFAVTFSERIGVEGYHDAVAMVGESYTEDNPHTMTPHVESGALAAVQVLAGTLTAALDTRAGIPSSSLRDPDNARLAAGDRVDDEFVQDLTTDYRPGGEGSDIELSVLLSYTDPPTDVAVDIATNRLTPYLPIEWPHPTENSMGNVWGEHGDIVSNYAEMLSRNDRASTLWLGLDVDSSALIDPVPEGTTNLDLVLQRDTSNDGDDGQALAAVVENGVTYGGGDGIFDEDDGRRRSLMRQAIETIGRQDTIPNPYMNEALAAGVEHNMDLIGDMITVGLEVPPTQHQPPDRMDDTHDFLREVMRNEDAGTTVRGALEDYMFEQISEAEPSGDARRLALERVGAVEGVVIQAESNAVQGSIEDRIARQQAAADAGNYVVGLVPYLGPINDAADAAGMGLGDIVFPADYADLSEAEQNEIALEVDTQVNHMILLAWAEHPEYMTESLNGLSEEERADLVRWAQSEHDDRDSNDLTAGFTATETWFQYDR